MLQAVSGSFRFTSAAIKRGGKVQSEGEHFATKWYQRWWFLLWSLPKHESASRQVKCSVCVCVCGASLVRSLPESVDSGTIVGFVLGQVWLCSPKCPSTTNKQRAAVGIHTWDTSLVYLSLHFSPHPSLLQLYSSTEPCTNNTASLLARAWARDQPEPIGARQYYMCVVSQY